MNEAHATAYRCGYVALVGRPNAGKSTLLNRLVGQKVSITAPRPQTTRQRILGIKTLDRAQLLYVDTPGFHRGYKRALNRYMNAAVSAALEEADVVVFIASGVTWDEEDEHLLQRVAAHPRLLLAINKIDTVRDKRRLLPYLQKLSALAAFKQLIPVSAKTGDNVARLEQAVVDLLPFSPPFYPEDQVTDRSVRFLAAEIIREALTRQLEDELPYRVAVEIETFSEREALTRIGATIWVDQERCKSIVIGKDGAMLKKIGTSARAGLEELTGSRVFLELWVKVKQDWMDSEHVLRQLGYD